MKRNSEMDQEEKIKVYVSPSGGRYVKMEDLLASRKVQETLRNLPDLVGTGKSKKGKG